MRLRRSSDRGRPAAPAVGGPESLTAVVGDGSFLSMSDVIDLSDYIDGPDSTGTTFAIEGGDDDRSRLALPVWRALYLLDGDRGGVVWTPAEEGRLRTLFVLDLATEPARTHFDASVVDPVVEREPPAVEIQEGRAVILLARDDEDRTWFLVVDGPKVGGGEHELRNREDLLFVAGECAGLVVYRKLHRFADGA